MTDLKRDAEGRHAQHVSFCDKLIGESRLPAGAKDVMVATLDHLATPADAGVLSFGDGDARKPLVDVLREQLGQLPPQVSFKTIATKPASEGGADLVSFSDLPGYENIQVDADRLDLDRRIKAYAAQHKVDYATAAGSVPK